jgi:hypothetical protein
VYVEAVKKAEKDPDLYGATPYWDEARKYEAVRKQVIAAGYRVTCDEKIMQVYVIPRS